MAQHATHGTPSLAGRILRFGSVGLSGAAVNLAILAVLVHLLQWPAALAALLSIEASTIWNHHWNRRWTWHDRPLARPTLWRYHVVTAGAMGIQWGAVVVGTTLVGLPVLVAAALGVALGTAWNYLGNDRFSFAPATAATSSSTATAATTGRRAPGGAPAAIARIRWPQPTRGWTYAGVALLLLVGGALLWHPWDTYVMQESTRSFLVDGTTPYETARVAPDHIYPSATLPAVAQWYAYPPLPLLMLAATYWPAASGLATSPALGRLLIKLPILLGTLALPWAAARFLGATPGATAEARASSSRLVERALLLNPLILLVALVWGQFEAVTLLALVGAFAALRAGRTGLAGGLWGAALLVKILPLYLAPLLAIHLWRRFGLHGTTRFFLVGGAVFGALCLPFLLLEPVGFYQQVLGMHLGRPPARFAPLSALYHTAKWASAAGIVSVPLSTLIDALSLGSFLLTIAVILLVAIASTRWPADEPTLLWAAGITMLVALLATKVLNEQYLVLPIGLLALAAFHPHGAGSPAALPSARTMLRWGPPAVVVATLLDNYHFLTFIAPDVLEGITGAGATTHAAALAWALGLSLLQLQFGLDLVVGAILVGVFAAVLPTLRHVARDAAAALAAALPRPPLTQAIRREVVLVHTLIIAIAFPVLAVGMTPTDDLGNAATAPPETDPALLALYTTAWFNPSQNPDVRDGTWDHAITTPRSGHYTVNAHRASEDLRAMRAAGAHGVVISYDPTYERQAHSAVAVARERGMPHALHVDVSPPEGRASLTAAHIDDVVRLLRGPGLSYWNDDPALRLGPGGAPVLFLDGVPAIGYTFSEAELRYVTSLPRAPAATDGVAPATTPATVQDLFAPTTVAAEWRALYRHAQATWWDEALARAGVPQDAIVVVSGVPVLAVHASHGSWVQHGAPDPVGFAVDRLGEEPLGVMDLRRHWSAAEARDPDAIVVPWNQHHLGRAVEPTHQHGDRLLETFTVLARR